MKKGEKEREREALHQFSKYFQAVHPSVHSISCELYRTLATKIVAHRGTIDRSTCRFVPPTRCHPFPAISSGKGGILCYRRCARVHPHDHGQGLAKWT